MLTACLIFALVTFAAGMAAAVWPELIIVGRLVAALARRHQAVVVLVFDQDATPAFFGSGDYREELQIDVARRRLDADPINPRGVRGYA